MNNQIIITKEDLGLEDTSPSYPRKVKTYEHFFINGCNLLFSQNKLISCVKEIEINFAVIDYQNSEYLFTDEDVCKTHLAWAKADLRKYCEPNSYIFNKKIKRVLKDNLEGVKL
jgi:Leu/Phe-tRNA-protein transferase